MAEIHKLTDLEDLEGVLERSHRNPVWIFKHSLICPVSTRAWEEYLRFSETDTPEVDFTVVEIQRARPVSAAIAERTGVRHESPQAILLSAGCVLWHASHMAITEAALVEASAGD